MIDKIQRARDIVEGDVGPGHDLGDVADLLDEAIAEAGSLIRDIGHASDAVEEAQAVAEEAQQNARDALEAAFGIQQEAEGLMKLVAKQRALIEQQNASLRENAEALSDAIRAATNWRYRAQAAERILTKPAEVN